MRDNNFFEPYIDKNDFDFKGKNVIILSVLGFLVFLLIMFPIVNKIRVYRMNKEITRIDREINSAENQTMKSSIDETREEIAEIKGKTELLDLISADFYKKDNVGDFLVDGITDSMTGGMFLKSIEISEDQIIVNGVSIEKESIARFERNLRRIIYFKDVFIPSINLEEEFYEFTVNIAINSEEVNIKKKEQLEEIIIDVEAPPETEVNVDVDVEKEGDEVQVETE